MSGGVVFRDLGEYDAAIADFDTALKLGHPDPHWVHFNRGTAYMDKGDYDRAIAEFDRALALKPDYAEAREQREAAHRHLSEFDPDRAELETDLRSR